MLGYKLRHLREKILNGAEADKFFKKIKRIIRWSIFENVLPLPVLHHLENHFQLEFAAWMYSCVQQTVTKFFTRCLLLFYFHEKQLALSKILIFSRTSSIKMKQWGLYLYATVTFPHSNGGKYEIRRWETKLVWKLITIYTPS